MVRIRAAREPDRGGSIIRRYCSIVGFDGGRLKICSYGSNPYGILFDCYKLPRAGLVIVNHTEGILVMSAGANKKDTVPRECLF